MKIVAGVACVLLLAGCGSMADEAETVATQERTTQPAEQSHTPEVEPVDVDQAVADLKAAHFALDLCFKAEVACADEMAAAHAASVSLAGAVEDQPALIEYLAEGDAAVAEYDGRDCASKPGDDECLVSIGSAALAYQSALLFTSGL